MIEKNINQSIEYIIELKKSIKKIDNLLELESLIVQNHLKDTFYKLCKEKFKEGFSCSVNYNFNEPEIAYYQIDLFDYPTDKEICVEFFDIEIKDALKLTTFEDFYNIIIKKNPKSYLI